MKRHTETSQILSLSLASILAVSAVQPAFADVNPAAASSADLTPEQASAYWGAWAANNRSTGVAGLNDTAARSATLPSTIPFNYGQAPIPFVELTLDDLVDPSIGGKVSPDQVLMVELKGGQEVVATARDLLDKLNVIERRLSETGKSLRNEMSTLTVSAIANPEIWVRELRRNTDMKLTDLVDSYAPGPKKCLTIALGDLGTNPTTNVPWTALDQVTIPGQGKVRIGDIIPKLNNEQTLLCSIGLSLLDNLTPGSANFLEMLLENRVRVLQNAKIDSSSALYEVAQWAKSASIEEVRTQYQTLEQAVKNPTPEKLYSLAQQATAATGVLALPNIPSIPAPRVTVRSDLHLKKHYDWPGFSIGNQDIASAYANGWAEIRSGKAGESTTSLVNEQALQAEAKFGVYLISHELNLLGATLDSALDPSNAKGSMTYCYLGVCSTKTAGISNFGISDGDPALLAKSWQDEYEEQLVVGIIPVVVRFGGTFTANLGWSVGLNLLSASGGINGKLNASAMGEAAVGIEDFVEAGIGGTLTLIDDTIAINGNAQVKFLDDEQPVLEASLTGDNTLSSLDGEVYAYALLDCLGPIGRYLDLIVDGLKQLGDGQLQDFLAKIGNTSAIGQKLVGNLHAAGRDITNEWNKGADAVKKVFHGWSNSPTLIGGMPFGGLTVSGTKIRYQQDWGWHGSHTTTRFLNYQLYIGPDGKEFGGDLSSYSSDAIAAEQENISLTQRENAVAAAEADVAAKKAAVLGDIGTFLTADSTNALTSLPGTLDGYAQSRHSLVQTTFRPFEN